MKKNLNLEIRILALFQQSTSTFILSKCSRNIRLPYDMYEKEGDSEGKLDIF